MSLTASHKQVLQKNGFVFLPQFQVGTEGDAAAAYVGRVLSLGASEGFHVLKPAEQDHSTPNTYSGIYGLGAFPFHTDLAHWQNPPRYLLLRCVKGFREVPTLLVDGAALIAALGRTILRRSLVKPRRPVAGYLHLLRILEEVDEQSILRWDDVFIRPASGAGEVGMTQFRLALDRQAPTQIALIDQGDTLIIDNWRMLHARSVVPPKCESRSIERAYLGELA